MSQYTLDERAAIMANARAILAETAPAAQREAISPHTSGSELVYKTRVTNDERPRPRAVPKPDVHETYDDDDAVLSASAWPTPRPKPLRENPGGRGSKSIMSIATASCAMRSGKFSVSSARRRASTASARSASSNASSSHAARVRGVAERS